MSDDHARSDREVLAVRRRGMLARVARRTRAKAEIAFPAVPSLASHYAEILADHFAAIGRPFAAAEIEHLQRLLIEKLREAHDESPAAQILVRYGTADDGSTRVDYAIAACVSTLAEKYTDWIESHEPPLFGSHPDARVMAEARALPAGSPVLDVGAGTGRNTLPLARLGLSVDAIEPTPAFADALESDARNEGLPVRVHRADVLLAPLAPATGPHALLVASELTSHFRRPADLRLFFRRSAAALRPGGRAVLNAFLTIGAYRPDTLARELGQAFWSTFFTPEELAAALQGLPLKPIEDIDAFEYEKSHLPPEAWPPTSWYESWARGIDVFSELAQPAISLRWLVFERTPGPVPSD